MSFLTVPPQDRRTSLRPCPQTQSPGGFGCCTWVLGTRRSEPSCVRVSSSYDNDTLTQSFFLPLSYHFLPRFLSNI